MIRSLLFLVLLLVGCSSSKHEENAVILSQLQLTDLEGKEIDLTLFEDKVIFVNFWATWCSPCIQEMPSLAALQNKFSDKNIEFLFASDESMKRILKFKQSHSWNLNFVQVGNQESLGIEALPTTFIFNGEGELVFSEVGIRDWDEPATIELVTNLINEND